MTEEEKKRLFLESVRVSVASRKPGGQSVGVCIPAVTVEHIYTGATVTIGHLRSQYENKTLALQLLELAIQ